MDEMELKENLSKYLQLHLKSPIHITNFESLNGGGGACQDNYSFDLKIESGQWQGDHNLVLRTDKGGSLYASISKEDEFGVTDLAYHHSVKTPKPYWMERDPKFTGNPFFIMERISGKANGRYIVKEPFLKTARENLADELAQNLAKIHSITPAKCIDLRLRDVLYKGDQTGGSYTYRSLNSLIYELDQLPDPHPAMELILNWALNHIPNDQELVLVHGDFRTGNFMVSEKGLEGILDWEFAHWGDPCEDIAWLCLRDWRFGKNNLEAGGFSTRLDFYKAYDKYTNTPLDIERVRFWEVVGNLRWALGSAGQAQRHLSGKAKGIELAAIGRRSCEMEYEAMRLIEHAR
jgi:aminoglycoside phosphotransferase (APT) family kinase protein